MEPPSANPPRTKQPPVSRIPAATARGSSSATRTGPDRALSTEPDVWARTWKALIEWGHAYGIDWLMGRELPSMVSKLGLGQPQAQTDVQNIRGRDREVLYFELFFAGVRDR